ncbi:restriction endonuclease subunit S [Acinetobacter indicus]|nr:restriction endonuclease subunit S [Acinetobacter indicus]
MAAPKLRFKEFDGDWTGLKIKDLVKSLDAGVSVNSEDVEPQEYEYSVLKTSCISSGYFDENERKRVLQDGEIQRLKEPVLDDSILMSRMNTPLLVGMNAYVFNAPKNTFLPDRLWQLKIDNNKTVTRWLAFYLGSDQGLNQIRDLASGTSNSMKNITKPDVLNIDLFAPQKEEQTKIASFLSAVDEKISQLTQKHELLSQYKQGMMQKLFSQQLRFKADDGSEFGEWEEKELKEVAEINPKAKKLPANFIYIDLESVEKGQLLLQKILNYRMHQVEHKDY